MKLTQTKLLEEETQKATQKMVEVAARPHGDDLQFAKAFIDAQYELILCLINEKMNYLSLLAELANKNVLEADSMLPSGNKQTLH